MNLTQAQFDALVSISFNCGTAWLQETGTLRTAITSGLKGNAFLYAMGLWSTANGKIEPGLINRRLAEANLYLNGKYEASAPSNYTYAKLDLDGDAKADKVQAYDSLNATTINVTPVKSGYTFMGWYNDAGKEVKQLDLNTSKIMLTAKWQKDGDTETAVTSYTVKASQLADKTPYAKPQEGTAEVAGITLKDTDTITVTHEYVDKGSIKWVKAAVGGKTAWFQLGSVDGYVASNTYFYVTVKAENLNYRTYAGTAAPSTVVGQLKKGTKVMIVETKTAKNGTKDGIWGKIGDEGATKNHWIYLDEGYTDYSKDKDYTTSTSNKVIATGSVIADSLNIRAAATTDSAALKTQLKKGDAVKILAIQNDGSKTWGKIAVDGGYGWINLAYVDMTASSDNTNTSDNNGEDIRTGVIANTDSVNIREKAGARNKLVKTLPRGTKVTVYQTTTQDNAPWGRIGEGQWVAMMYVTLDAASSGSTGNSGNGGNSGNNSTAVIATGVVNSTMNLKVRTGPGMTYNQINSLPTGTQVSIYEETTTAGASWGRIGNGQWVCLNYVTIQTVASGSTSANGVMATVINCANAVNIRAAAGVGNALVGVAAVNSRIKIYETTDVNGISWGRTDKGWVCMDYIRLDGVLSDGNTGSAGSTTTTTTVTATVTANSLNIRKDHSNTSEDIGDLKKGDKVTIVEKYVETTEKETKTWGKFTKDGITGWINLAYTTLEETTTNVETPKDPVVGNGVRTGKIINVPAGMNVNVRAAAGVTNTLVTTLPNGTAVKVYEQVDVNNATWAKIDQGWVYMYYIQLDAVSSGTNTNTNTNNGNAGTTSGRSVGIVNSNIDLNVRSGPGVDYPKVNSLKKGTQIIIYEQTLVNGMLWGRIDNNQWVSLNYVTLTASSGTGTGVMGTITNCGVAVNVRSAPGVNNALVGTIQVNSRVEIYEQTLRGTQYWGRVNQGWICMQYVTLDSAQPPITDGNGTVPTEAPQATDPTTATETPNATEAPSATEAPQGATNNNAEIAFSATAKVTTDTLNVRKDATADSEKVGEIKKGESYPIYALKAEGEKTWAKIGIIGTTGWVNITHVKVTGTGAVTTDLNIRKDATADSEKVGTLNKGDEVTFSQIRLVGQKVWGKISGGWINLAYVKVGAKGWEITNPPAKALFTVTTSGPMNLYKDTDTASEVVVTLEGSLDVGITEFKKANGENWGKVYFEQYIGWIRLDKTISDEKDYAIANPPAATLFTATTTANLAMYAEANAGKTSTEFASGTELKITEVKAAGGEYWGKVYHKFDTGWVQLNGTSFTIDGTISVSDPDVVTLHDGNEGNPEVAIVLANGTAVKISALKVENSEGWAKITVDTATGWVKLAELTSVIG